MADNTLSTIPAPSPAAAAAANDICFLGAAELAAMIRQKKVSVREVMSAHLRQIEHVNSKLNAIVTLVPEASLMAQARAADEALSSGAPLAPFSAFPSRSKTWSKPRASVRPTVHRCSTTTSLTTTLLSSSA